MATVASLMVRISADVKDFNKGVQGASKRMDSMGKSLIGAGTQMTKMVTGPIVALGAGILGLATKTANYADTLLDLQQQTGLSTDTLQEYRAVADAVGTEQDFMASSAMALQRRLSQLDGESGKSSDALEKLGISMHDADGELRDMDDMLPEIVGALADMEEGSERQRIGVDLLGGSFKDLAPVLSLNSDEINKLTDEAHESSHVLGDDALNAGADFKKEMDELRKSVSMAFVSLGSDLIPILQDTLMPLVENHIIPALTTFGERVGDVIEWFDGLEGSVKRNILIFAGVLASIGPVLIIMGVMAKYVAIVIKGFGLLVKVGGFLVKVVKIIVTVLKALVVVVKAVIFVLGLITAPIALIIVGIVALIAVIVLVVRNWEWIKDKAIELWGIIKDWVVGAMADLRDDLIGIWEVITEFFTETVPQKLMEMVDWFRALPERIMAFFILLYEGSIEIWNSMIESIVEFAIGLYERLVEIIGDLVASVVEFFLNLHESIVEIVSGMIESVIEFFENLWNNITRIVGNLRDSVVDIFLNMRNRAVQGAIFLVNRVINFFSELPHKVWTEISGLPNLFWNLLMDARDMAIRASRNILSGIRGVIAGVPAVIRSIFDRVKRLLLNLGPELLKSAKEVGKKLWNGFKGALGIGSPSLIDEAFFSMAESAVDSMKEIRRVAPRMTRSMRDIVRPIPTDAVGRGVDDDRVGVNAVNGVGAMDSDGAGVVIKIENMQVRNDDDIERIAEKLFRLQQGRIRAEGGRA